MELAFVLLFPFMSFCGEALHNKRIVGLEASGVPSIETVNKHISQLKFLPQNDHPSSDSKSGPLDIEWDGGTFFTGVGHDVLALKLRIRRSPHSSTGRNWPLPHRSVRNENVIFKLDKETFKFKTKSDICVILESAFSRYREYIVENSVEDMYDNLAHMPGSKTKSHLPKYQSDLYRNAPIISHLDVVIERPCTENMYPSLSSNEAYYILINHNTTILVAKEIWGALRGLETFSQLVWKGPNGQLYLMETAILDKPRFSHRGLLIDTARHYIFKEVIYEIMDGMEQNKMNVFHWHMTDDNSFPFKSKTFPEMSEKGAFHPELVYTHEDIADVIQYGRLRGIRVIPEFDIPGHTYAWGLGRPELLTQCHSNKNPREGLIGPMDPTKESTYAVLKKIFTEILALYHDEFVHVGGDEVVTDCWKANPDVMRAGEDLLKGQRRTSSLTELSLWEYFENRVMQDMRDIRKKQGRGLQFMLWQEAAMKTMIKYKNETVVQVWTGDTDSILQFLRSGYRVIYSSAWYLDNRQKTPDWPDFYITDPFPSGKIANEKVLGGEACLWGEFVDNENLMTTLWPRASAVAERLWSEKNVRSINMAASRLHEQRCRMLSRGLGVNQINGPDYCLRRHRARRKSRDTFMQPTNHRVGVTYPSVWQTRMLSNRTDGACDAMFLLKVLAIICLVLAVTNIQSLQVLSVRRQKMCIIVLTLITVLVLYIANYNVHTYKKTKRTNSM